MAGTNAARPAVEDRGPAIILVEPQLGENIGAAARAMLNCGLTDLRLVRPRDGWPNPKAVASASGAGRVLETARLYDRVEDAIADLQRLYATTARARELAKPVLSLREAAPRLRQEVAGGLACGVLFGPERTGLLTEHVALADVILSVPLNPAFASLNLAQAVLLLGYEWFQTGEAAPPAAPAEAPEPATRDKLLNLFLHLEQELDEADFFITAEKRPSMVRNLRTLLTRASPSAQEVRTLHGVVTALAGRRKDGRPRGRGEDKA